MAKMIKTAKYRPELGSYGTKKSARSDLNAVSKGDVRERRLNQACGAGAV